MSEQTKEIEPKTLMDCCLTFGGDSDDNSFRMLFNHHPNCPELQNLIMPPTREAFRRAFDAQYEFWKKYHLDKIKNQFYANHRQPPAENDENSLSIYVLIAVDEDSRVKECIPVSDLKTAGVIERILMKNYGSANVCKASRKIDDIPFLIQRRMMLNAAIDKSKQALESARGGK